MQKKVFLIIVFVAIILQGGLSQEVSIYSFRLSKPTNDKPLELIKVNVFLNDSLFVEILTDLDGVFPVAFEKEKVCFESFEVKFSDEKERKYNFNFKNLAGNEIDGVRLEIIEIKQLQYSEYKKITRTAPRRKDSWARDVH
jgi:hypothetical protein